MNKSFLLYVQDKTSLLQISKALTHFKIEHDIKENEQRLDTESYYLQTLLNALPNPIFYKDEKGFYTGCNKAFEEMFGLQKEDIIGKSVYDFSPKDLADIYFKMDQELYQKPGIQVYESCVLFKDGKRHHVIFHKATFNHSNGSLAGIVGIVIDITKQKKAEKAFFDRHNYYSNLFEYSNDAILLFNNKGNFIDVNPQAIKLFGYTKNEFLKKNIFNLHKKEDLNNAKKIFKTLIQESWIRFKTTLINSKSQNLNVEINTSIIDEDNKIFQGIVRDIK